MITALLTTGVQDLDQTISDIAGELSSTSKRVYASDAKHFAHWMLQQSLTPSTFTRSHMIAYRSYLDTATYTLQTKKGKVTRAYSRPTKQRMFSVATSIMKEQHANGLIKVDVTARIDGFKVNGETTHTALSKQQSKEMVGDIDTSTLAGKRDDAIIQMLLKTGIRRAEIVALNRYDLKMMDGHNVAVVEHGKGEKKRIIKLRPEVLKAINSYLAVLPAADKDAPLFVSIRRGDHPTMKRLTGEAIEDIVKKHAPELPNNIKLTPHGLRATYATIALESGASLEQVQYSLGHSDPRTTERYQKRKLNLDNNAVDYLNF